MMEAEGGRRRNSEGMTSKSGNKIRKIKQRRAEEEASQREDERRREEKEGGPFFFTGAIKSLTVKRRERGWNLHNHRKRKKERRKKKERKIFCHCVVPALTRRRPLCRCTGFHLIFSQEYGRFHCYVTGGQTLLLHAANEQKQL